jgi:peptidoglycan hydrolase-like protein with peptidoglycan-binding domain
MNFMALLSLLPTILQAVELAQEITRDVKQNKSLENVVKITQEKGPQVADIFKQIGSTLFPNLGQTQQVAAAAVTLDHENVKRIQMQLNVLGAKLDADGYYGKLTKAAVVKFQGENGLTTDGWVGPLTQAKLNEKAPV